MSFVLDGARLAVPGEEAVEVTVEQWRKIIRSETVLVDGREITAEDGPFTIKRSPRRTASVERIADSPMGSPLAGDIPVDPPVSVDVMTRDPMDSKTADAAYIYASLSSSPVLMDLQKSVLEELDGLGAAYDAQEPEHFHITLLYLFKIDNLQLEKLIEAIQFPAAFTVDGVRIGTFKEADDKPVVLMVNPDNALLRIQRELYERALSMGLEISPFSRPSHYKPHVTLAYDLQPPDQKLPRMDAPVRLTVDSIAITRPDYRMARAIRLPQVPGGAAFITRSGVPTPGFFERQARQEQTAVARAIGEVRRRLGDFVESLTGRHLGPGDHPSGSPQTVHAGNGADGAENELWGREHHRPVVLELEPEAESLVELRETIADWPNDARWIAESLLESTQSPERVMEDPVLYEEAKKRYLHEETERMVEEIYDDADSFADLPVPEDEMVAMGNDEIESEIRDIARERVEASFDDSHFFDWMEQDVIDMGGIYNTEDITIGLARDQETDEIVGAFSLRQAYGFEMREPYRIVESMESPETEEAHLALADEWEGQNYLSLDWLASGESGNGYGSTMMGHIFEIASLEDAGIIGEPTGAAIPFYERFDAVIHDFGNRRILWSPEDVDDLASQFQQEAKAADFDIPTRAEPEDDLEPKNGAYARRPTDGAGVALYDWRAKLGLRPLRERAEVDDPDEMGPSPDREIGTVATGGPGRSGFTLLELPPPQPNSIVSLGYTPMTLEWGQFADGAFDFMRLREEALRERHKGPGDHPSGSPQQVHAGDDAGAGDESGDGSAGEDGEPVAGEEGMEDADEFEVEDDGPERRKPFREALNDVGDATTADPATYWSDVYEDVKALHQEAYRLEEEGRRDEAIELRRQIKKKLVFDSLAFAEQTEAWRDTTEEEFAGAFPQVEGVGFDEDAPHEYDAMRMMGNARETAWRVSLERAIHRGDVPYDKEVLEARGYYENSDRWVPLEGRDLYHVTTAASAVLDSGLKSRFELSMDHGVGLGGGPDDTISFTADRETARAIELSLHEARMVARNDITARDLVEAAAEGRGAEEPFVDNVLGSLEPGYEPGDYEAGDGLSKVDPRTRERFDGRVVDSIMLGSTLEEYRARNGSEWEPYTEGRYEPIESTTGGTRYRAFVRSMTESEQREFRFRVYKTYSTWRQQAGGRMDPLFFASDPQALAEVDASEIRTMRYEPRPNSMGMQAGALGEIRTPSTEGLEFVEDIEFVESEDDDILAERHLGPGDHPSGSPQEVHAGGSGKLQRLAEKVSGDFRSYDDVLDMFSYWQEFMRQELGRDIVRVGIGEFERTGTKGTVIEDEDGNRLEVQIGGFGGDQEVTLTWIRANNKGTGLGTAFMEAIKSTVDLKGQKFRVAFVSNPDFYSRFDWLAQEEQAGFWEGRGNFTYDPR